MITLPPTLQKNTFTYTLVVRDGDRAIYRQHINELCHYYEVFRIKTRPEGIFKGKVIPEREVFPIDADFGVTAWSFQSYERALLKYNTLKS